MKLLRKINSTLLFAVFLPWVVGIGYGGWYYRRQLYTANTERLATKQAIVVLWYQTELAHLREVALLTANDPVLRTLLGYQLQTKLNDYLMTATRDRPGDSVWILTTTGLFGSDVASPLASVVSQITVQTQPTTSGAQAVAGDLLLFATAPLYLKNGQAGGIVIVCRKLMRSDRFMSIRQATGLRVTLWVAGATNAPPCPNRFMRTVALVNPTNQLIGAFVLEQTADQQPRVAKGVIATFLGIGLLGGSCIVVGQQILLRAIVRPLFRIRAAADRIRQGDYHTRIVVQGDEELCALAQDFNAMADQIEFDYAEIATNHQALAHINQHLETRIAERTQALAEQNRQLRTTQQQLIVHEKLASLGELTAGIAHEIKNPLNIINSFAQIVITEVQDLQAEFACETPNRAEIAELMTRLPKQAAKIRDHGQRAAQIIDQMLEHSHLSGGMRQPTILNEFVKTYVNLAYHGIRAKDPTFHVTIQEDYDPALQALQVALVPQDIGRVLFNLILNAWYALSHPPLVEATPTLRVTTRDVGDFVTISIRDNGPGIPADLRQKIFQPFFTTKPAGQGTGLGLSLSYEIITQGHGGKLEVVSQEGAYTEFTIWLPKTGLPAQTKGTSVPSRPLAHTMPEEGPVVGETLLKTARTA